MRQVPSIQRPTPHFIQSWGRATKSLQQMAWVENRLSALPLGGDSMLALGFGRSYGDVCQIDGGLGLGTQGLDRFISFNAQTGVLRAEAGVSLQAISDLAVPRGWFLPVSPGTQYVSLGGAIANDVHGKNHHGAGSFGRHVRRLGLLRSDVGLVELGADDASGLFEATVGGLGLTGLVVWAEIALIPVSSSFMQEQSMRFSCLEEFVGLSAESDRTHDYTVAWIDCSAPASQLGRGVFHRANHADDLKSSPPAQSTDFTRAPNSNRARPPHSWSSPTLHVPVTPPVSLVNRLTVPLMNRIVWSRASATPRNRRVHFRPFFYPLDGLLHWNRLYGPGGFYQHQSLIPEAAGIEPISEMLGRIKRADQGSFLAVLKRFGPLASPGLLSFPRPGLTLAIDFQNRPGVHALLEDLDSIVEQAGGRLYPAKDARMSSTFFQKSFPMWMQLEAKRDPKFNSSFWRRVTGVSR